MRVVIYSLIAFLLGAGLVFMLYDSNFSSGETEFWKDTISNVQYIESRIPETITTAAEMYDLGKEMGLQNQSGKVEYAYELHDLNNDDKVEIILCEMRYTDGTCDVQIFERGSSNNHMLLWSEAVVQDPFSKEKLEQYRWRITQAPEFDLN